MYLNSDATKSNENQCDTLKKHDTINTFGEEDSSLLLTEVTITNANPVLSDREPVTDIGNSIISKSSWSSIGTESPNSEIFNRMLSTTSLNRSQIDHVSYNHLLTNHTIEDCSFKKTIDLKDIWERFETSLGVADKTGIIGHKLQEYQNSQNKVN